MPARVLVLVLLVCCAALPATAAAPPIQTFRATWEDDRVVLTWTQQSTADWICVHGVDDHAIGIYRACRDSQAGAQREELPPHISAPGDFYNVVEWHKPVDESGSWELLGDYWTAAPLGAPPQSDLLPPRYQLVVPFVATSPSVITGR